MDIQSLNSDTSFIRATTTNTISVAYASNNIVGLTNSSSAQVSSSSSYQIITIKLDNKLVAPIIIND